MGLNKLFHSLEPLWWSLFGLGGAVAAFLLPAHIIIQGVLAPAGWVSGNELLSYDRMITILSSPIAKIYFLILIVFPLYHAAHRIRMTLDDLRIGALSAILPLFCYGGATVLSIVALIVVLGIS